MHLLRALQAWFGGGSAARLEAAIRLHESGDLAGGALTDDAGFARALETAYRGMWLSWIASGERPA